MRFLQALTCIGILLAVNSSQAATSYTDGFDSDGNPVPTFFHQLVIGDFNVDGDDQGWDAVRMPAVEAVGGVLTNVNTDGLGSDGNADGWVWLRTPNSTVSGVPESFKVGELPGQYDVVQFDIRFDQLPPQPLDSAIRGRSFLQGVGNSFTHGVTYAPNSSFPADNDWHTYTIIRDFNDGAWEGDADRVRIDIVDGLSQGGLPGNLPLLQGTKFSVDNVILGRTTATAAFPAITQTLPNIIRNGDLSDVSNVVLSGDNDGAFDINGGNGNYGPFRGSSGDVDHWTPFNNNPNSIVEAVADGGALDLLGTSGVQGSFYLDTHWSTGGEQFSLNSAGGYLNGLTQTDILNGVAIDETANYEFAFDINFNDRPSNPNSNFKVALTLGANETDANSAGSISIFDDQLSNITAGERQVLSISGATLKAAQDSGDPVNLIIQSQANTSIVNFPGTPVPDNHVDSAVFTQVQVDNLSLVRMFNIPTGDVNKDGVVTQADVSLAQLYLDGNGGETAEQRQNDLANAPSAPFASDILASLNLADFDLTGNDFFDAADVAEIAALVTSGPGDFDGDGDVDGADFLGWQRLDPSQIPTWESNYGVGALTAATAVPEPTTLVLAGLLAVTAASASGRHRD